MRHLNALATQDRLEWECSLKADRLEDYEALLRR